MAVAAETLQHRILTINEPIRIDAFEGSRVPTEKEHFEAIRRGVASPIIPGIIMEEPNLMNINEEVLERQQNTKRKATSIVIGIAERYKKVLIKSGTIGVDAEAAFDSVIQKGFNAIRTGDQRQVSMALVEPISIIAEVEYLPNRSH